MWRSCQREGLGSREKEWVGWKVGIEREWRDPWVKSTWRIVESWGWKVGRKEWISSWRKADVRWKVKLSIAIIRKA